MTPLKNKNQTLKDKLTTRQTQDKLDQDPKMTMNQLLIQYRIPQVVMNEIYEYGEYIAQYKIKMNIIYEEMEMRNTEKEHRRSIYKEVLDDFSSNLFCYNCGKMSLWMMRKKLYNCSSICDHQYRDGGGHFGFYGVPRADNIPYGNDDEDDEDDPYREIFDENEFLNKSGKYIKNPTTMSDYISNHKYDLKYVFEEMEVIQEVIQSFRFDQRQWRYAYDTVINELK